jgi:starvation-inducible DNA-binding protein
MGANKAQSQSRENLAQRRRSPLITPTDLGSKASMDIAGGMNAILADVFALYMKTKNFHWHMSGPHFRDHHLLLDEQADQLYSMTEPIAERIRKTGGSTLRSIGPQGQRCGVRRPARYVGGAARGQSGFGGAAARGA